MTYGDKRNYPKIDIFWRGLYRSSTTWSKTCREAKERFIDAHPNLLLADVKANFSKR